MFSRWLEESASYHAQLFQTLLKIYSHFVSYPFSFNKRRPNSQRSNPICCLPYMDNTMPADALATLGAGHQQAWYWPAKPEYTVSSITRVNILLTLRVNILLTLNVRGPSYLGLTRSISWLLMPWLLTSPGHQQPWYWLYGIFRFFSYLRKCFKYLCQINVEEWHKM